MVIAPDKTVMIDPALLQVLTEEKTVMEEKYLPNVVEPSFGIGRIVYVILEHCFKIRAGEDAQSRTYFIFPPVIAPVKCSILPLVPNEKKLTDKIFDIKRLLNENGISSKVDDSGNTIGRRYARTDEVGIPFAITIDFDTLKDETVTLREITSMEQIRLPIAKIAEELAKITTNASTWTQLTTKYPKFASQSAEEAK